LRQRACRQAPLPLIGIAMRLFLIACGVLALAACHKSPQPSANRSVPAAEAGPVKGVDRTHKGQPFPDVHFGDSGATKTSFARFKGVPTLVNIWATWCIPCIKELPTLDKLAQADKAKLWVVPISQDTAPRASVDAFLDKIGLAGFTVYYDPTMSVSGAMSLEVLPTTIMYDAQGKEVWRYVGGLDWTSPGAAKLLEEGGVAQKH
jgi:thiol-disulfide isomerase/thioredoxin